MKESDKHEKTPLKILNLHNLLPKAIFKIQIIIFK